MIEKHLVELRARHLIGAVAFRTKAVFEIKLYGFGSARGHDLTAVFRQEVCVEFFAHAEAIERSDTERQERFANVEAGKFFALKNDHAPSGLGEQRRGGAARRATTNDCDVVDVDLVHCMITL